MKLIFVFILMILTLVFGCGRQNDNSGRIGKVTLLYVCLLFSGPKFEQNLCNYKFFIFLGYSEIGWVSKHCKEQQANVQNECLKKVKIHPPNVYCDEVMEDLGKC